MTISVDVDYASQDDDVPRPSDFRQWVVAALSERTTPAEVSIKIIDEVESATLNHTYRGKDYATNVLSFPSELPLDISPLLGDLAICAPVVRREALEQHKATTAHWAHMVVHGTLHLLGYDHIEDQEAEAMEGLETEILTTLGFAPPYAVDNTEDNHP